MARQRAGIPEVEGYDQQGGQSPGGDTGASTGAGGAAGGAGATSAELRGDQERPREVAREGGSTSGAGRGGSMQRGLGRSGVGSIGGRGQGPSLIPMLMSNPALMASAFMSNPFGFAQAMTQEMDRVFSAFDDGFVAPIGRVGGGTGRSVSAGGAEQGAQSQPQSPSGQQQSMQQSTQQSMQQRGGQLAQWIPQMEVLQRGDQLVVRADLPGLTPDDVQIEIEDGVLTVSGERRQSFEDRQDGFYRTERSYGAFSRSIALPEGVNEDQVQARFEHGVLEVTAPMPQQPVSRSRRVQVQSGSGASQSSAQQSAQSAGAGTTQDAAQSGGQNAEQSSGRSTSSGSTSAASAQGAADLAGQSPS